MYRRIRPIPILTPVRRNPRPRRSPSLEVIFPAAHSPHCIPKPQSRTQNRKFPTSFSNHSHCSARAQTFYTRPTSILNRQEQSLIFLYCLINIECFIPTNRKLQIRNCVGISGFSSTRLTPQSGFGTEGRHPGGIILPRLNENLVDDRYGA